MNEHRPAAVAQRVWDLPVRLVHWAMVALLIALVVTATLGRTAMDLSDAISSFHSANAWFVVTLAGVRAQA